MVDINDIYKSNSDNIKAEDIGNNMWTLTIKSADVKDFDNGAERKLVLSFNEWEKNLPLNVTNARAIADLHGHNSNAWVGKQIMLFTMKVDFQGKPTLGIRVRAPQVSGPPPVSQQNYAQASTGGPATSHQRPLEAAYDGPNAPPPNGPEDYGQ